MTSEPCFGVDIGRDDGKEWHSGNGSKSDGYALVDEGQRPAAKSYRL